MARTLVIGDTHDDAVHPAYLAFCSDTAEEFACDDVVHIGDVRDEHSISAYANDENAPGIVEEDERALAAIKKWHDRFPKARVCIGNHDERILRVLKGSGAPSRFLRSWSDINNTPGWRYADHWLSDGILYVHGHEKTGMFPPIDPARNHALKCNHSVVMGHFHSKRSAAASRGHGGTLHYCNTGCGVDEKHPYMSYGRGTANLSLLGCAVVLDGTPFSIPMRCEHRQDPYHPSKHTPKRRRR